MEQTFSIRDDFNELPTFTNSIKLTTKLIDKNFSESVHNSKIINKNECLICYNKVCKNTSKISCKLCSNLFHYKCYKDFTEKNSFYAIKYWWNCCW